MRVPSLIVLAFICSTNIPFPAAAHVASARQAPAKSPDGAAPTLDVALTARALAPGEVVRVDVSAPMQLKSVQVTAFDRTAACTLMANGAWRTILGVDLDVAPGAHTMTVDAVSTDDVRLSRAETLTIAEKEFPTRQLRVNPRFVTPPRAVQARIVREAARLQAIFDGVSPAVPWSRPFGLPIDGALVSGFGVRSVFNGEPRAPHSGADFASPSGTPVHSPGAGIVALSSSLYFTGGTIVIDHGQGLYSLFAHLSQRQVREHAAVDKGQVIGRVGKTGRVTGPHLHWTVRLAGARVDPLSLVFALDAPKP
jgi:murein DD-endopeptidase MepM/ murein hydrolase activator NlpD